MRYNHRPHAHYSFTDSTRCAVCGETFSSPLPAARVVTITDDTPPNGDYTPSTYACTLCDTFSDAEYMATAHAVLLHRVTPAAAPATFTAI